MAITQVAQGEAPGQWEARQQADNEFTPRCKFLDSTEFLPIVHWGHVTV
jgi:hypothetical protein